MLHPGRRKLYTVGKRNLMMAVYDIASGSWSQTTAETGTSSQTRLVYVPTHDVLVGISSVVPGGFYVQPGKPQGRRRRAHARHRRRRTVRRHGRPCNGVWVPSIGAIVGWSYGADFWTLTPPANNPTTNAWTKGTLAADAGNTITLPGALGRKTRRPSAAFYWSAAAST